MNLEDLNDDLLLLIIDMVCKKSYIPVGILNKRFYSLFNSSEHEEENDSKKDNSNDNNNNNILIRKTKPLAKESSLKYMLDMSNINELFQIYGCKISPGLSRAIVEDEHYGLHQWCKQTCSNNNTDDESSDLDTISCNTNNDCLTVEVVWKAAEYGKLDIIRDFWDISSDWDNLAEDVAQIACERGHLNTLKWLKEEMDNTATVNGSASDSASSVGQSSQPSPFIYEIEGLCDYAASNGHLDILQWLLQLYKDRIKEAKEIGNQNIVDYLQNDGILWNEITFCGASSNGQTYVCQFLRENDCPWDASAIAGAAKYNHLEVSKRVCSVLMFVCTVIMIVCTMYFAYILREYLSSDTNSCIIFECFISYFSIYSTLVRHCSI